MSRWSIALFMTITTMMLGAHAARAGSPLVKDGEAYAQLTVQADASKALAAAELIRDVIAEMSGVELPIVIEGGPAAQPMPAGATTLLIGHTQRATALGVAIPSGFDPAVRPDAFNEEGYVLKTIGDEVVVAGNQDFTYQGTLYAAYALLEQLGYRWYMPGELWRIVPRSTALTLPELDIVSRPDFAVRSTYLSGWVPVTREERAIYRRWSHAAGFNPAQQYPLVGDGFLAYLLPPLEYAESNPEYFALNEKGERVLGRLPNGRLYENHANLCIANPAVLEQSVRNLRQAFAGERKMRIVSELGVGISPPDGAPYCYCEEFSLDSQNFDYPRYVHETMMSEEYFGFAAKIAEAFPDKFVSTMAYSNREMPPEGVDIPSNIMVMICPISCDVLEPITSTMFRRAQLRSILEHWVELTPHVTIYDYNPGMLTGFFLPERDMANMAINARVYREIGVKGMSREGRKAFMQTWLSYYLAARLLWDADADVDAMKQDFYTTSFGEAAGPHVQRWWDACEQRLLDATIQAHEDFLINHVYDSAFVASIAEHLDDAAAAQRRDGADGAQVKRLMIVQRIADHLAAFAAMTDAERSMDYAAAAKHAARMVELKRELGELDPFMMTVDENRVRPYFAEGRAKRFAELAAMTDGRGGVLLAQLPQRTAFRRDPFNEGVINRWYRLGSDALDGWSERDTFLLWEQQEEPISDRGHDYDGYGWHHFTVELPEFDAEQPVRLFLGGAINEAWVWVNGRYVGRRDHKLWWDHDHEVDLDVTDAVKPGETNTVVVRVHNDVEVGGLYRRGFLYAPQTVETNAQAKATAAP